MEKIKILFISANPQGTPRLKLDEEVREIQAKIRAAEHRDSLELITNWAVRPDDLLQSLNEHKPHVVHFSGHGSSREEITLLDKQGDPKPVSKAALVNLFHTLKDNIRVVILNACFSRPQAEAITREIDCAIGMTHTISDDAAITFAASFYRAIGFGRSVRAAFDQAKTALLLEGIREEKTPVLMTGPNIAPESIVLVNLASQTESLAENLGQVHAGFNTIGSMGNQRFLHSATLLKDGRVLIAGGMPTGSSSLFEAEVYDPSPREFTAAGEMMRARARQAAVLVDDRASSGKVLIVGGADGLDPAELFDPATLTFAVTKDNVASLAGRGCKAVALKTGKVLVVGSLINSAKGNKVDTITVLHDPYTDSFWKSPAVGSTHPV
jgi:hypothetical protein